MGAQLPKIERSISIRQKAYEVLREAIISGAIKPGEKLSERRLATELGISKTPIREVLQRLEQEGLVKTIPQRGVIIERVSLKEFRETMLIRCALEKLAIKLALQNNSAELVANLEKLVVPFITEGFVENSDLLFRADREFHDTIIRSAASPRLEQIMDQVDACIQRTRILCRSERLKATVSEHSLILEAVRGQDMDKAERAIELHIENTLEYTISVLKDEEPGWFEKD